jgi:hypothetical protein
MLDISFLKKTINIGEKDKLLLQLSFADAVTPDELADLLSDYDIENARFDFTLLLAFLLKKHPYLKFPEKIVPRLEGIIRFSQYKNVAFLQAFKDAGTQLNRKKIPVLLIRSILMRYLNPKELRLLFDVDFVVSEENYEETIKTALETGFAVKSSYQYSTHFAKGAVVMNIYRLFMHETGRAGVAIFKEMFTRAKNTNVFGIDVLIPATEDLMIIALTNAYRNLVVAPLPFAKDSFHFYDIAKILQSDKKLNWDTVFDIAAQAGVFYQIWTMLHLFDWMLPGLLPDDLLAKITPAKRKEEVKIIRDIITRNSNKLRYDQWRMKLYKCKSLKDFTLWLSINARSECLKLIRNPLACYLFAPVFYFIVVNRKEKEK